MTEERFAEFRRAAEGALITHYDSLLAVIGSIIHDDAAEYLHRAVDSAYRGARRELESGRLADFERRLAGVQQKRYWVRAAVNSYVDAYRATQVPGPVPDDVPRPTREVRDEALLTAVLDACPRADPGDDVARHDTDAARAAALRTTLRVLTERGEAGHPPSLTQQTFEVIQLFGQLLADQDDRGIKAAVARGLGINAGRVTEALRSTASALTLTRYAGGVLAAPRTLRHDDALRSALATYDAFATARPEVAGRLGEASGLVETGRGTRVAQARVADPQALHSDETAYAHALGNPHPNCVLCCAVHNPTPDRTMEF